MSHEYRFKSKFSLLLISKALLSFIAMATLVLVCPVMNSDAHASETSQTHSAHDDGQDDQMSCCTSMEERSISKCDSSALLNSTQSLSPLSIIAAVPRDLYFHIDHRDKLKNLFEVKSSFDPPLPARSSSLLTQQISLLL